MSAYVPKNARREERNDDEQEERVDSKESGKKTYVECRFKNPYAPQINWKKINENKQLFLELLAELGAEEDFVDYIHFAQLYLITCKTALNKTELKKCFGVAQPLHVFQKFFEYDVEVYVHPEKSGRFYLKLKEPLENLLAELKLTPKVRINTKSNVEEHQDVNFFPPLAPSANVAVYKPVQAGHSKQGNFQTEGDIDSWINDETYLELRLFGLRLKRLDNSTRRHMLDKMRKILDKAEHSDQMTRVRNRKSEGSIASLLDL